MKRINTARLKRKFLRGTKGVISLFLAILMVPFVSIAAMLVNAGRVNSAVAIFDEALCNASNSTLGTYDEFLRNRFALMAISQDTSDGGAKYGNYSASYTAENLINDIFKYYMEKNVGTLSNTYVTTEVSGNGLYPLSDNSVLLSSVLQSSKITVPTKLATDWGAFDDMLSKLTEGFDLITKIEEFATNGFGLTSEIDALVDSQEALEGKIRACNTARTKYTNAYNDFKSAADDFNDLVDRASDAADEVETCQAEANALSTEISNLNKDLKEKQDKLKKLEENTENDNTDEIEKLNKEIDELKERIDDKKDEKEDAGDELTDAEAKLSRYSGQFTSKRNDVINKKSVYYDTIVALRDKVNETSQEATSFQSKANSVVNKAEGLVSSSISLGVEIAKDNNDKTSEQLKNENEEYAKQKQKAEDDGNSSAATGYYNMIQENNSTITNLDEDNDDISNADKLQREAFSSLKSTNSEMSDFAERNLVNDYRTIYDSLERLRRKIAGIEVPTKYESIDISNTYYRVINPVEAEDVANIVKNIENEISGNSGWILVKTVVGFIKAMFDISIFYDSDLKSNINTSLYSANGGLPSKRDRTVHPITSEFEEEDEAQSDAYKNLLNSFSTDDVYDTSGDSQSLFDEMQRLIGELVDNMSNFKLRNLKKIANNVLDLFSLITGSQITNILKDGAASMGKKMLLIGYISYNTANRTTYKSGKALTGASYNLPKTSENIGYAFSGAEMEYIFNGSMSEEKNQRTVFQFLWIERVLLDIAPIAMDATILQLATDLGAVTFGIGAVLVYAVYFLAESFVDTVILANGEEIPMAKSFVYLTPNGFPKLIKALFSLSLNEAQSKSVYEKAGECVNKMDSNVTVERYDDVKAKQNKDEKKLSKNILDLFNWDYTKSTQILLLLFRNTNTLLSRLADIIQMESTYHARKETATYNFNLDKSYTYLRASGNFSTNMFIKIGTRDSLTSQKRIVYNGY